MNVMLLIIYGMLFGVANIIPGVSGGTMAASLGIYDDLIRSISNLKTDFKKSMRFLVPLFIGAVTGLVLFSYSIEFLLGTFPLPTALAFIGLIFGGLPLLIQRFKDSIRQERRKMGIGHVLSFALFFGIIVWMSYISAEGQSGRALEFTVKEIASLFAVGTLGAASMVIPGISGSLVFMIFGYYYPIIRNLNLFFSGLKALDWAVMINSAKFLSPFGVGVLLGVFLISKIMEYLFANYSSYTYSAILGLVISSPIAVLNNTNAFGGFHWATDFVLLIIGLVVAVILGWVTYALGKNEK